MAAVNYKQIACFLTPGQHEELKRLSAETLVPMQVILRQAVDKILAEYKIRPKSYRDEHINARLAALAKKRGKR
ncbi:MAG: ribbon-helix-helix domain-containing protein [Steroidobacteraceae bacterium]